MRQVFWRGSTPKCDVGNGHPLNGEFSDAKLPGYGGQWGLVCKGCAKKLAVSYGTGRGQRYELQADSRWLKVEG